MSHPGQDVDVGGYAFPASTQVKTAATHFGCAFISVAEGTALFGRRQSAFAPMPAGDHIGFPNAAAYGATKAALASLTRAWAAEFSPPVCV